MKKKLTTEQLADAKRLKDIFESKKKQLGISQEKFADELGKSQGAISHYLNGTNALNLEIAADFANKLGVTINDFSPSLNKQARKLLTAVYGDNMTLVEDVTSYRQYPLLNWADAGNWCEEPMSLYHKNNIKQYDTSVECSYRAFWLEVKDDSMNSPNGLSIPQGMIILVDPEVKPITNNLVVAKLEGEKKLTFKQLITEGYDTYLKPLNPQYNMIPLSDKIHILGVVVEAKVARLP
ncbi:LexA family protein [Xenorhabdus cabanillasii]|uniref:Repressor protein C2 n=1 Tax=Xenorhabdus cabanillasii JM26 TaxID=1427517 RepID=W1J9C8_9GAMM|nr:S24 family peptidase [Xenorhabdus cabanillasii]PHM76561.1 repressor [Xenorhabdus cabanillasii JM26]CDL86618.1 Repressor protein C2 [Xenorhabdus cabanillasii JM26]